MTNKMQQFWLIYLFIHNHLYVFRAMSSPIIMSTWLYLQRLILSTDIAAGWCHGWDVNATILACLFIPNQLYMFRAMSSPIIRSTWLYLQRLILSTGIDAGWCHGWDGTQLFWLIYLFLISFTCFGLCLRPSSGAPNCIYSCWYCPPVLMLVGVMDKMWTQLFWLVYLFLISSTCFGRCLRPSSGAPNY